MPASCLMSAVIPGISNFRCKYPDIICDFGFLHAKLRFFTRTQSSRLSVMMNFRTRNFRCKKPADNLILCPNVLHNKSEIVSSQTAFIFSSNCCEYFEFSHTFNGMSLSLIEPY